MGWYSNPVHEHHLILVPEKGEGSGTLKCGACTLEIPGGDIYYWCNLCSSHLHETCAKLPIQVKHFFHLCPLFLHMSLTFVCNCCLDKNFHLAYHCDRCLFDMCLDCTTKVLSIAATSDGENEGERILHCCHHHPLQLLSLEPKSSLLSCQVCNMPCSLGGVETPTWGCEQCNFHLHKSCLDFLPQKVHMKFPSKSTPWVMQTLVSRQCSDCDHAIPTNLVFRKISGGRKSEYLCISCCLVRKLIDESYPSQLSKVVNHFFHPCSDLKLILSPFSTCNACFQSHHHFSYHCESCDFFLCFDCAQLPQLASQENEANQLVQHFCHWHPLKLFTGTQDTHLICNLCEVFCSEPYYSCNDQCRFYVHKSCMDSLPHKTNHRLLSQTLVLRTIPSFKCTTCCRQCSGLTFYCSDRKCNFCIKCVLWPENKLGVDGRFTSARHWHQLSLCETEEEHKVYCFLCKESCIGRSYKCIECDFYFHKSCAELPTQLDHQIHPQHSLRLTNRSSEYPDAAMTCKLCLQDLSQNSPLFDWVYQCYQCDFQLDIQCAFSLPSLEYTRHPHLLYVVVNMHGGRLCQACGESCDGISTFHCANQECDFSLHLHCGPLPRTIKHALHVHPLTLQDYYVEDNDSDEFACHVCENYRSPRQPVYCCSQGCFMLCETKCAESEVLPILRGEHGEVELITPFPRVACRVINSKSTFADIMLVSSSEGDGAEDEVQQTKYVFRFKELLDCRWESQYFSKEDTFGLEMFEEEEDKRDQKLSTENEKEDEDAMSSTSEQSSTSDKEVENYLFSWNALSRFKEVENYLFSWNALSRFKDSLHKFSYTSLFNDLWWQYDGSIMTGPFALPESLGPIYEEFFVMFDIFDDKYMISYAERRFQVFIMCAILHKMRITKVVDVQKRDIELWFGWIRNFQKKGNNIRFLADNIKQVWGAHYYIESKRIVDKKSVELREEVEQETKTVEELRTKLAEAEARLEDAQRRENEHDAYRVEGSRGPMKKERSDALEIKWRTCYESLVLLPGNAPLKSSKM